MNKVRTRFAPSPTGFLHIGSLRTALYAYALAKHAKGDFILRIEDTDQKREVEGATAALKETLQKFGFVWDEYYVQSERLELYKKAAEKLVSEGHAFFCQCKPKNAKGDSYSNELRDPCRNKKHKTGAIKLKVPDGETIEYNDFVHNKKISWNSSDVYDATLLKSDSYPTYHLAAMVDDIQMKVSHVLRGHDWLPSTPIHLLVLKYLKGKRPEIGHLTDILSAETGKKLSKRRDSVFAEDFLKAGYLAEALLNYIILLGWAPKDNREFYTLPEFVANFDPNGFGDANPKFFVEKLDWMNSQYIQKMDDTNLGKKITDYYNCKFAGPAVSRIVPLTKTRIKTLAEFETLAGFFFSVPEVDKSTLGPDYLKHLTSVKDALSAIKMWNLENINNSLSKLIKVEGYKTGNFYMDLRIAITGRRMTPPVNESIEILGQKETLARIAKLL